LPKALAEVWHELALQCEPPVVEPRTLVDQGLLVDCDGVRVLARKFASERPAVGSADIEEMLKEHGTFLLARDRRWRLEAAFFADRLQGGGAEGELKVRVLNVLQTNSQASAIGRARAALANIVETALFTLSGPGTQAVVQQVCETVAAIEDRRAHSKPRQSDEFYMQARDLMGGWLRGLLPPEVRVGPGACPAAALATWLGTRDRAQPETLAAARLALTFGWLLSEASRRAAVAVLDAAAAAVAPALPPAAGGGPPRARAKAASGPSAVAGLFAKRR
jgi:hypothetical protein